MRWFGTVFGVRGDWGVARYERVGSGEDDLGEEAAEKEKEREEEEEEEEEEEIVPATTKSGGGGRNTGQWIAARFLSSLGTIFYWSIPGLNLNAGQSKLCSTSTPLSQLTRPPCLVLLILSYLASLLTCIITNAPLVSNPNRAGFLALAQLPPVFLLSAKNSPLSLLLPPFFPYTHLNALHRWAGRGLFLAAGIHGSLWINNHLVWRIPILGMQKETSGVAAFAMLCVIVLGSLRFVRRWCWGVFYWVQ